MEKRKLQKNEIEELVEQYQNLTEDLKRYRKLMWSRDFRNAVPEMRKNAKQQAAFFKSALNATVDTLIDQDALPTNTAIDALFNRFITFKTKWMVSDYLRNVRKEKKTNWIVCDYLHKNRKKSKSCSE